MPFLIGCLLTDTDADVRESVARALGSIGSRAVPAMITALGDPTDWGQFLSPEKLARIGPAAVPALITALSTPVDSGTFYDAVEALGLIGSPAADVAVPVLISALSNAKGGVREGIAWALGRIDTPAAKAALRDL